MKRVDPVITLIVGILLLFIDLQLAKTVIAIYLIVIGALGLSKR